MTRRERHIRIIASWGSSNNAYVRHHLEGVIVRKPNFGYLTDEAIEALARSLLNSRARQNALNEQNRKLRRAS